MPLVRLKCPACASVVRIAAETAAVHPVVRCARCQGLVNVTTSRLSESSPSTVIVAQPVDGPGAKTGVASRIQTKEFSEEESAAPHTFPWTIVGILIGLLVLGGIGAGAYFLFAPRNGQPEQAKVVEQGVTRNTKKPAAARADSAEVDFILSKKSALMRSLVSQLKSITDAATAEACALGMDNTVTSLAETEKELKDAENKGARPSPDAVVRYAKEQLEIMQELMKEISRVAFLPGVGQHLVKLDRRMKELGLIKETALNSAPTPPPAVPSQRNEKNPFEETAKADEKNPFETVKTEKKDEKNPFENVPSGEARSKMPGKSNPALTAAVEKMNSTDVFTRHDGVKEVLAAKPDDAFKADILETLLNVIKEADPNTRGDAFKAFKKWATSRQDKESVGKAMEVLLQDPFIKKDVIKYVADHQIVSAAPELAKLLRDHFERLEVARALVAIGQEAEKATIPLVSDLEPQVRKMAIEVLAQIGTMECVPELRKMQSDRYVGLAAKEAVRIILIRSQKKSNQ
jgi:hypothetical protein